MSQTVEPKELHRAEAVFGSGIEILARSQGQFACLQSIINLLSTSSLGCAKKDCLAIIGSPERLSEQDQCSIWTNASGRVEIFSDRKSDKDSGDSASASDLGRLHSLVRSGRIRRVLLATPVNEGERIAAVMKQLEGMDVDVDFIFKGFSTYSRFNLGLTGEVCVARILRRPLTPAQSTIKSFLDRVGAFLLLLVSAPLLLSIALIVKLSSAGPVFFRQKRFGLNNEVIEVFKFRTLYHSCSDSSAQQPVKKGDDRVTPVGKYLRALSLDELPQLLNVVKGDMSLVGPRPLPIGLKIDGSPCSDFPHYRARHRVLPGITGLAQVNGCRGGMRVKEDLKNRLAFDLAYVENYSLLLDMKIMFATALALLRPNNAY
jgi:exopolysaccharide biosynthesis polyprenyl glycosylphosphotransferase